VVIALVRDIVLDASGVAFLEASGVDVINAGGMERQIFSDSVVAEEVDVTEQVDHSIADISDLLLISVAPDTIEELSAEPDVLRIVINSPELYRKYQVFVYANSPTAGYSSSLIISYKREDIQEYTYGEDAHFMVAAPQYNFFIPRLMRVVQSVSESTEYRHEVYEVDPDTEIYLSNPERSFTSDAPLIQTDRYSAMQPVEKSMHFQIPDSVYQHPDVMEIKNQGNDLKVDVSVEYHLGNYVADPILIGNDNTSLIIPYQHLEFSGPDHSGDSLVVEFPIPAVSVLELTNSHDTYHSLDSVILLDVVIVEDRVAIDGENVVSLEAVIDEPSPYEHTDPILDISSHFPKPPVSIVSESVDVSELLERTSSLEYTKPSEEWNTDKTDSLIILPQEKKVSYCDVPKSDHLQKAIEYMNKRVEGYVCGGSLHSLFHHQKKGFELQPFLVEGEIQRGIYEADTIETGGLGK